MQERLQKITARAGIASRRHAEQLIVSGQVRVNGQVARELGTKADAARDRIEAAGHVVRANEAATQAEMEARRSYWKRRRRTTKECGRMRIRRKLWRRESEKRAKFEIRKSKLGTDAKLEIRKWKYENRNSVQAGNSKCGIRNRAGE